MDSVLRPSDGRSPYVRFCFKLIPKIKLVMGGRSTGQRTSAGADESACTGAHAGGGADNGTATCANGAACQGPVARGIAAAGEKGEGGCEYEPCEVWT
jgi:hypothetical protein